MIQDAPSRVLGRTHASQAIIDALKKLPRALKLTRNEDIEARNAERALRNAQHAHDAVAHPDPASDDESLITVSDVPNDALSPPSRIRKIAAKLSPTSARYLLLTFVGSGGAKRPREDDEPKPTTKKLKKLKEEIAIPAGMNMPLMFGPYLSKLYLNNLHAPFSLFTRNNLDLVNNTYDSIATVKRNALGASSSNKQIRVLDTASFEKKVLAERLMDRGQWLESARNYITFLEVYWEDRNHPQVLRWSQHFTFFAKAENQESNYPAILATDIKLRRAYIVQAFEFSFDFYLRRLTEEICMLRIAESNPRAPPSLNGGGGGGNGVGRSGGRGGGGDASNVVCLLCARRGHLFSSCTHNTFEDGTPLYCRAEGTTNFRAYQSGMTLCRLWNIKYAAASCTHDPTARAHLCSFCGNKNHHAFSWTCRRNPRPSAA